MLKIQSEEVTSKANIIQVHTFLTNLNNFKNLFPEDKISDWVSSKDKFSLKIQKMYTLELEKVEVKADYIKLSSGENASIKFDMKINLTEVNAENTTAQILCNIDINPILKAMVSKPLNELFNYMANKIENAIKLDELD
jgi:carbon monoxide dehydrogenase subunit G